MTTGPLLRAVNKSDRVAGTTLTTQVLYNIVKGYGVDFGITIAPHDLRRTFARNWLTAAMQRWGRFSCRWGMSLS